MALVDYDRSKISLHIIVFGPNRARVRKSMTNLYRDRFGEEPNFDKLKFARKLLFSSVAKLCGKKYKDKQDIDFFGVDLGNIQGFDTGVMVKGFGANISHDQLTSGLNEADCVIFIADENDDESNLEALTTLNEFNEEVPVIVNKGGKECNATTIANLESAFRKSKSDLEVAQSTDIVQCFKYALRLTFNRLQ